MGNWGDMVLINTNELISEIKQSNVFFYQCIEIGIIQFGENIKNTIIY